MFNKLFPSKKATNKINVGCGPSAREGWINVDIQSFSSVDVVMDVTKEWQFSDISYVYAEHFLEHLKLEKGVEFIYNAGQSLVDGGWLRLSTPNVEWVLKTHYKPNEIDSDDKAISSVAAINRAFHGWGHEFLYSPQILEIILSQMNFSNIRFCEYGHSELDVFQDIEEHGKYSVVDGSPSVIIMEAQKGGTVNRPLKVMGSLTELFVKHANAKG